MGRKTHQDGLKCQSQRKNVAGHACSSEKYIKAFRRNATSGGILQAINTYTLGNFFFFIIKQHMPPFCLPPRLSHNPFLPGLSNLCITSQKAKSKPYILFPLQKSFKYCPTPSQGLQEKHPGKRLKIYPPPSNSFSTNCTKRVKKFNC